MYHAPAVAAHKDNVVLQDGAARPAAALQDGSLQDVPLVGLGVVALHQHHVQMGKTFHRSRVSKGERERERCVNNGPSVSNMLVVPGTGSVSAAKYKKVNTGDRK